MTDDAAACIAELESIHVEIAAWFDGSAKPDALDAIMSRFASDFTLVSTAGAALDRAALTQLFAQAYGARRGCTIVIRDIAVIAAWPGGAVLGFTEHQSSEAATNVRRSTAVFDVDAARNVRWRRLHETFTTT
ncbi:hypothetical protein [Paraburkholderia sp.]|uniref:hypothetical protein n=1 Tax=Paraburkholderia sp. TaxID=1926495 RepID=UPI003D6EA44F